ncbi:MAG: SCO1664 family protein [Actinomycetota bacterium]|nr:SCO1664 family protein [Actinomycetota bacterium]
MPGAQRSPGDGGLSEESLPRRERTESEIIALLAQGDLRPLGLMPHASNGTFLCELSSGAVRTLVVYKPRSGEAPLWDFPDGTLCQREVAAYAVSAASGWDFVPPTILRDGPMGPGSVQLFIDAEPAEHYFTLAPARDEIFQRVAAFDIIANNADRKSGHCLLERDGGRIWVVDHGVTFHVAPKLRTVIWDYEDEHLPKSVVDGLERLGAMLVRRESDLAQALATLLHEQEVAAIRRRIDELLVDGKFPGPGDGRPYPWPPV